MYAMPRPRIALDADGNGPKRAAGRPKLILAPEAPPEPKSAPKSAPQRARAAPIPRPGLVNGADVNYYVGDEVCFTRMFGLSTLFVVVPETKTFCVSVPFILGLASSNKSYHKQISHIYLAANRTYRSKDNVEWEEVISELLDAKFYVSLEINWMQARDFVDWNALENTFFCLVMRYSLPNVERFRNAAVRIDDDFNGTNGGVWTHSMSDLTVPESPNFTPWGWFSKDKPIK